MNRADGRRAPGRSPARDDRIALAMKSPFLVVAILAIVALYAASPVASADEEAAAPEHWAFQHLAKQSVPTVQRTDVIRTPVDRYIQSQLEKHGLALSPPTNPDTLLRRLNFDLIGLPPSPDETAAMAAATFASGQNADRPAKYSRTTSVTTTGSTCSPAMATARARRSTALSGVGTDA